MEAHAGRRLVQEVAMGVGLTFAAACASFVAFEALFVYCLSKLDAEF
jgi:hypothetical protein